MRKTNTDNSTKGCSRGADSRRKGFELEVGVGVIVLGGEKEGRGGGGYIHVSLLAPVLI